MTLPTTQADALLIRARRLYESHRRRAKADGVALDYGMPQIRELLQSLPICEYCRMPVGWDASLDHRIPIARRGRHAFDNLVICCRRCNALKGQLTEEEFGELLDFLIDLHPTARQDVERRLLAGGKRYEG